MPAPSSNDEYWAPIFHSLEKGAFAQSLNLLDKELSNQSDPTLVLLRTMLKTIVSNICEAEDKIENYKTAYDSAVDKRDVLLGQLGELTQSLSQTLSLTPNGENGLHQPNRIGSSANPPYRWQVSMLGSFELLQNGKLLEKWPSQKGKSILKYLVLNRSRPIAKEVLMDKFWPDSDLESARNNLNVVIYGIRKALRNGNPDYSHLLYSDDSYQLNPNIDIWLDVEIFQDLVNKGKFLYQRGQTEQALEAFHTADELYNGEFLEEDRYEDWVIPFRQDLQDEWVDLVYLMCEHYLKAKNFKLCIPLCKKLLNIDSALEEIHQRLMICYAKVGQINLAIRQYHTCLTTLEHELGVPPSAETIALIEKIKHREPLDV